MMGLGKLFHKKAGEPDGGGEKGLLLFYLPGCPYCRQAETLIAGLMAEHPEYAAVPLRRVNELTERRLAGQYDYWYTPSLFLDGEKVYEADSRDGADTVRDKLADVFREALERTKEPAYES